MSELIRLFCHGCDTCWKSPTYLKVCPRDDCDSPPPVRLLPDGLDCTNCTSGGTECYAWDPEGWDSDDTQPYQTRYDDEPEEDAITFTEGELGLLMGCHQVVLKLIAGRVDDVPGFIQHCSSSKEIIDSFHSVQLKLLELLSGTETMECLGVSEDGLLKIEKTKDGITSQLWKKGNEEGTR